MGAKKMVKKKIRSRINEHIPNEAKSEINKICENRLLNDNNRKSELILEVLDKYEIDHTPLGPGTNRTAVLIDGYVFKFAMDKWGKQDNANEFAMSEELQPYVIKVYETNDLILVCEYVTVLSGEDFMKRRVPILEILSVLAESYLIGDVAYIEKNFTNWGYRDNGELVILDFAYIYNIVGDELLCPDDGGLLNYDNVFHDLYCSSCRKKYSFMDVRKLVTMEQEMKEINTVKATSYILKTPTDYFEIVDGEANNTKVLEEEMEKMDDGYKDEIEYDPDSFERLMDSLEEKGTFTPQKGISNPKTDPVFDEDEGVDDAFDNIFELYEKREKKPNNNRHRGNRNNNNGRRNNQPKKKFDHSKKQESKPVNNNNSKPEVKPEPKPQEPKQQVQPEKVVKEEPKVVVETKPVVEEKPEEVKVIETQKETKVEVVEEETKPQETTIKFTENIKVTKNDEPVKTEKEPEPEEQIVYSTKSEDEESGIGNNLLANAIREAEKKKNSVTFQSFSVEDK